MILQILLDIESTNYLIAIIIWIILGGNIICSTSLRFIVIIFLLIFLLILFFLLKFLLLLALMSNLPLNTLKFRFYGFILRLYIH